MLHNHIYKVLVNKVSYWHHVECDYLFETLPKLKFCRATAWKLAYIDNGIDIRAGTQKFPELLKQFIQSICTSLKLVQIL
jgi:hypothetical protein